MRDDGMHYQDLPHKSAWGVDTPFLGNHIHLLGQEWGQRPDRFTQPDEHILPAWPQLCWTYITVYHPLMPSLVLLPPFYSCSNIININITNSNICFW